MVITYCTHTSNCVKCVKAFGKSQYPVTCSNAPDRLMLSRRSHLALKYIVCTMCAYCAYYVHTVRTMCALCAHTNLSCLNFACIVCILHTLCEHDGVPFVLYTLFTCTHMCMCALCTFCAYCFLSTCSLIQHFSASTLCGRGHELRSYCSISIYVRVQNSRQMWPLKSNVPHSRCSKYRDTTLKANHILSCFSRAFPLNVNQMLQWCSFFASTTHGSPNRPLPNESPPHIPKRHFIFLLHASSSCLAVHQIKSI